MGWKAIDGDGNTLDGKHDTTVSEKDSYFEGAYADSSFAVDMLKEQQISKLVLQWDRAPQSFKIQTSIDGTTWTDVKMLTGESVNTIVFEMPLNTRYLKMQGVSLRNNETFKLREFEAYESVDKIELGKLVKDAEKKLAELGVTFADRKGYDALVEAYAEGKSLYKNALAEQENVKAAEELLADALTNIPEKEEKVTVTFDVDGEETSVELEKGKVLGDNLPENPVKEGFTFKGWNTEKDGTGVEVTADTVAGENMTVYAVFEKKSEPTDPENPDKPDPENPDKPDQENPDKPDLETPNKPDAEKPVKPDQNKPSGEKPTVKPDEQKPVKTGDTQSPVWYLGLMAAAGAVVISRRKKKED